MGKQPIFTKCARCTHPVVIGGPQNAFYPNHRRAAGNVGGPVYCEECWQALEDQAFERKKSGNGPEAP